MRVLKPAQEVKTTSIQERRITDLPVGMVFVGKIFDSGTSLSTSDGVFLVITDGKEKYLVNLRSMQVFRAAVAIIDEAATEGFQLEVGIGEDTPVVAPEPEPELMAVGTPLPLSTKKRWGI